ncbi:MAG TPA: prolyl oligopeptidase family serine peptidase [Actinomycetes bacterium]|nr:prolyl oligopeptidase family serine peptidase [Actinomycetes bacterium]
MSVGRVYAFSLTQDGRQLLVVADGSGRRQPWILSARDGGGSAARLIPVEGTVTRASWRPHASRFITMIDLDGREDYRLVEIDAQTGIVESIAAQAGVRNELGRPHDSGNSPYSPNGKYLAFATNRRAEDCFDVVVRDMASGAERTVITAGSGVPEDRYFPATFSWDSRQLIVTRLHQQSEQDLFAVDIATGQARLLTPHPGPAKHVAVAARPEGVYVCATHDGNHTGLGLLEQDGRMRWIDTPDHDIELAAVSADGSRLAWAVNEDGFTALRHCRIRDGIPQAAQPVAGLPRGMYVLEAGTFGHAMQLSADGRTLAVLDGLSAVWLADLIDGSARRIGPATGIAACTEPEVVRFASGDETIVPGFVYRPAGERPFPVVVYVHGGPEAQAMPAPDPLINGLVSRGIAVLAPNIRGSSGYGLRYQRLIYRDWGGGDLEDLRAAAEFLRSQPWVDPDRIGVYGASYGGFAALSCLTRLPEYWRAGVSESGVSDLVDDVRNFPPSWRRRAPDLVGDIDNPEDLRRLTEASPLSHAEHVRAPVLLLHGSNDTNVSVRSSDLFYERLIQLGKPVRYERIDDAGHIIGQELDLTAVVCDWLADQLLPDGMR